MCRGTRRGSLTERQQRAVRAAAGVEGMAAALDSIVDERGSPDKRTLSAGTPILQPTAERRSTGSHYTPRSLTEPIVRHALEPTFERLGPNARPEEVLDLKVCDPAMGSGAFLVEACRALAARLVQAWARWPETRPRLPADEDEDLHARRLVAQRCLYGVDKNPMATDLAKLSLRLATLARDHEATFLDHALKSGDSLVGLTRAQIAAVHWDTSKPGLPLFRELIRERFEAALIGRQEIREASDDVERAIQEARYEKIERRLSDARLLGDAVIAAFFSADRSRARIVRLRELHAGMDRTVLRSYRWDDLAARAEPQFLDETNEDDHKYQGRLVWPAEFRDEVLARLLALNAERAAAERENQPLVPRARARRTPRAPAETELLESVAVDEDD